MTATKTWIPQPEGFGARLRAVRQGRGLSQEEFSQVINVASATLSTWERGVWPNQDQAALAKLVSDEFDVNLNWLLFGDQNVVVRGIPRGYALAS